jgi:hypothetical protein
MMKLYAISLLLAVSSMSPQSVLASDAGSLAPAAPVPIASPAQVNGLNNPTTTKIVGSDRTVFDARRETGAMPRTTKINRITHGGDSSVPIDRMPGGNPLGGSGVSTGAKIPGPSGTINNHNELPATKNEVGGGAVAAPGS